MGFLYSWIMGMPISSFNPENVWYFYEKCQASVDRTLSALIDQFGEGFHFGYVVKILREDPERAYKIAKDIGPVSYYPWLESEVIHKIESFYSAKIDSDIYITRDQWDVIKAVLFLGDPNWDDVRLGCRISVDIIRSICRYSSIDTGEKLFSVCSELDDIGILHSFFCPSLNPAEFLVKLRHDDDLRHFFSSRIPVQRREVMFLDSILFLKDEVIEGEKENDLNFGWVYMLKCGDFVKIGKANDIKKRVKKDISPKLPQKSELIRKYKTLDPLKLESALHKEFSEFRNNGEWFTYSESLLESADRIVINSTAEIIPITHD